MTAIQDPRHQTIYKIYEHYEKSSGNGFRPHLGASLIGHDCSRYLWYTFRFAEKPQFDGRLLRLFETGHLEEERIIKNLRDIGCEVHSVDPASGRQFSFFSIRGHFGGSMDAAIKGIPEAPTKWHVGEFKTHNQKSFDDLVKNGVKASKPQHYAQMTVYMGFTGMTRALYFAVNKNTDALYTERIKYDSGLFGRLMEKAERIINATTPPERLSNDPAWYQCKWCPFIDICHNDAAPLPNCRTCAHAKPVDDGKWACSYHNKNITYNEQLKGCPDHRYLPPILNFAEPIDGSQADNWVKYRHKETGKEFYNGGPNGFLSREIHAVKDKRALDSGNDFLNQLKSEFNGELIE